MVSVRVGSNVSRPDESPPMRASAVVLGLPPWADCDRPSAYIPGDRRRAMAEGTTLPTRARGAALFADISGFTPLTEALANELGSERASEALTGHLDRVFHAVIAELHRFGGVVLYFSGDAITCWLEGDAGLRATAAGFGMQEAMQREGEITTPGGLSLQLGIKVAIAAGPARRFVVGDPELQLIDVLAGRVVDLMAESEHLAERGEVVAHESALPSLEGRAEVGEIRTSDRAGSVAVIERLLEAVPEAPSDEEDTDDIPDELARSWVLPAVYESLSTGHAQFLAELRPAYSIFVKFGGMNYDADESAPEKLDEFVRAAQRILSTYGGNVLTLTIGDKGAYLYGVFGTPVAHEDDAERVCAAALEVSALESLAAACMVQVGVAYGRLRSGSYGHARRRAFGCLGDAVNLAARLMGRALPGEIYVSEFVRQRTLDSFTWKELKPLQLKGVAAPVAAHALKGSSGRRRREQRYELPLVGRTEELEVLDAAVESALAGRGRVIGISAEAGVGKSRLIAEFVRRVADRGVVVASGECQSYGTSTGYSVWREIWRTLFGLEDDAPEAEQIAKLEQALAEIDPALVARAPLLDSVLGLTIPDNELTSAFDPKLRKTSLESLLVECLRARARREPLVLVLEDCQWLDALSRDLLDVLARTGASSAVLLLLAYRPDAALPEGLALAQLPGLEQLELGVLDEATMTAVVRGKLAQLLGEETEASASLLDLVVSRAEGNPFYAEELLNYVHSEGIELTDEHALASFELPDSLSSLILGRIDRLAETLRLTLKVASVVGRIFRARLLHRVRPELAGLDDLRRELGTLRQADMVNLDREEDESYLFKHAVTHEVAYQSLPHALRAALHGDVAEHLERQGPEAIERQLDLIAHHYWYSDNEPKKRLYLRRAGQAAQAAYANAAAIDYYERLVPLVPDAERVEVLLELGKVLELVGELDRACARETEALELADANGDERARARCEAALADVARRQARLDEAGERPERAPGGFEGPGDEEGLGQVLHLEGTLASQGGRHAEARRRYEESLEIRRRLGDRKMTASLLSNLGIVAEQDGEYELARSYHEEALELRTELGDRWAIAISLTNLGMIASLE